MILFTILYAHIGSSFNIKKKSSIRFGINIDLDFCVRFVPLLFFLFVLLDNNQSKLIKIDQSKSLLFLLCCLS